MRASEPVEDRLHDGRFGDAEVLVELLGRGRGTELVADADEVTVFAQPAAPAEITARFDADAQAARAQYFLAVVRGLLLEQLP
mgnify:CR=1 FL=1